MWKLVALAVGGVVVGAAVVWYAKRTKAEVVPAPAVAPSAGPRPYPSA